MHRQSLELVRGALQVSHPINAHIRSLGARVPCRLDVVSHETPLMAPNPPSHLISWANSKPIDSSRVDLRSSGDIQQSLSVRCPLIFEGNMTML